MRKSEINDHLFELSDTEKSYLSHPETTLSDFFRFLDKMGLKDENGVYIMKEDLIDKTFEIRNSTKTDFWSRFDNSIHQRDFVIKKATRFYREPFMHANVVALRYVYSGECIIYTHNKKMVLRQNDAILLNNDFVLSQHLKNKEDIVFTLIFKRDYIARLLQKNVVTSNQITRIFFD